MEYYNLSSKAEMLNHGVAGSFVAVLTAFKIAEFKVNERKVIETRTRHKEAGSDVSRILEKILFNYDNKIRPGQPGLPTVVEISIQILSFNHVSERQMQYSFSCYFRQKWTDTRLRFAADGDTNLTTLPLNAQKVLGSIWKPDTYFKNGKHAYIHELTVPNRLLRIRSDGQILLSQRLTITARCRMYLRKYPMDTQMCKLEIGSLGHTLSDLVYKWDKITIPKDLFLAQFVLAEGIKTYHLNKTAVRKIRNQTEYISVIEARIRLKRQQGYYLLQVYIPCSMIVAASWISFWLNQEAAIARCSLGVTTVLTMTTLRMGARKDLPMVGYLTALDLFLLVSFGFIIAALVEYIIIHVVAMRKVHQLANTPGITRRRIPNRRGMKRRLSSVVQGEDSICMDSDAFYCMSSGSGDRVGMGEDGEGVDGGEWATTMGSRRRSFEPTQRTRSYLSSDFNNPTSTLSSTPSTTITNSHSNRRQNTANMSQSSAAAAGGRNKNVTIMSTTNRIVEEEEEEEEVVASAAINYNEKIPIGGGYSNTFTSNNDFIVTDQYDNNNRKNSSYSGGGRMSLARRTSSILLAHFQRLQLAVTQNRQVMLGVDNSDDPRIPMVVNVKVIDSYAQILFPFTFFVFHALYWLAYIFIVDDNIDESGLLDD